MKMDISCELTFRKSGSVRITISDGTNECRNYASEKQIGRVTGGMIVNIVKKARRDNIESQATMHRTL